MAETPIPDLQFEFISIDWSKIDKGAIMVAGVPTREKLHPGQYQQPADGQELAAAAPTAGELQVSDPDINFVFKFSPELEAALERVAARFFVAHPDFRLPNYKIDAQAAGGDWQGAGVRKEPDLKFPKITIQELLTNNQIGKDDPAAV